jgi:DNA polymerase III alpha subunit
MQQGDLDGAMVNQLRAAALAGGWQDREIAAVLTWFRFIERYTFTRGHAAALAHVAWRVARIAAHYPVHFYAAVLDHLGLGVGGGMYPILVYVVEAQRHGVAVVGPTVNGPWQSVPEGHKVRCGLRLLQGVIHLPTLERIHAAARQRHVASVTDLCARVELTANEIEHLIAAGAVDGLVSSRRHARWEAQYAQVRPLDQASLLDAGTWPQPPLVEAEDCLERAAEEYATLGFTLSVDHPLALCRAALPDTTLVTAEQLGAHVGQQVTVAGVIVAGRRIRTTKGRLMAFASLCDWSGVMEMTLFERAAEGYAELLQKGGAVVATGRVTQDVERGVGVEVTTMWTVQTCGEAPPPVQQVRVAESIGPFRRRVSDDLRRR